MTTETNLASFYCSPSWHIENGLAFRIYELAYMLCKVGTPEEKTFYGSAPQLSEYFRYSERTIYGALEYLSELGFFVLKDRGFFESNVYKVVSHKDWIETHPDQCSEKLEYSYSGDGDPLGIDLYALSNGRINFYPFQIKLIRAIGFSEDETKTYFMAYLSSMGTRRTQRKNIPGGFIFYLRKQSVEQGFRPREVSKGLRGRAKDLHEEYVARVSVGEVQAAHAVARA